MMNKEWIGERVAMIDIRRALENVLLEKDDFGWGPNNQFKFPLFGGTGEFYQRIGDDARRPSAPQSEGRFHQSHGARKSASPTGRRVKYDTLISTMPLDKLCNDVINGELPREIKKATASLRTAAATWWASASSSRARAPRAGCISRRATVRSIA